MKFVILGLLGALLAANAYAVTGTPPLPSNGIDGLVDGQWMRGVAGGQNFFAKTGLIAAGTNQATAIQLQPGMYSFEVDSVPAGAGVAVPRCIAGASFTLYNNDPANTLTVYTAIGYADTINNGTALFGGLSSGASATFFCAKTGSWAANGGAGGSAQSALAVNDFLNSYGLGTNATSESVQLTMLQYTGVRIARAQTYPVSAPTNFATQQAWHNGTAVTGVNPGLKYDILMDGGQQDVTAWIPYLDTLAEAGYLRSIEGANEPNNFQGGHQPTTATISGASGQPTATTSIDCTAYMRVGDTIRINFAHSYIIQSWSTGSVTFTTNLVVTSTNDPFEWQYGTSADWWPLALRMQDLYTQVQADSNLTGIPIYSPSELGGELLNVGLQFTTIPASPAIDTAAQTQFGLPNGTVYADGLTSHGYIVGTNNTLIDNKPWLASIKNTPKVFPFDNDGLWNNAGPSTWSQKYAGNTTTQLLSLRAVTTEDGWITGAYNPVSAGGVLESADITEYQQAVLYEDIIYDYFNNGWDEHLFFGMQDTGASSPTSTGYGFFHSDLSPKLAATVFHNIAGILVDLIDGTLGTLSYSVNSAPVNLHELVLEDSKGNFDLVLTDEYFPGPSSGLTTASGVRALDNFTITLPKSVTSVKVYNPIVGTAPVATYSNVSAIPVSMSAEPLILQIIP
jgi:hypothetical protein